MRVQAIRASETLYKAGNKSFDTDYHAMTKDSDADVAIQAMLTLNLFKAPDEEAVIKAAQAGNSARGVQLIGTTLLTSPGNLPGAVVLGRGGAGLSPEQLDLMQRGGAIFTELCFTCHGNDGRGAPLAGAEPGVTMGPPLAGSPRVQGHRDYVIKALLNGLTGPVGGKTYTEVMIPMGNNKDEWIAAVASYVRNSFGNTAGYVTSADVARVRAATVSRKTPWALAELEPSLPHMLDVQPAWKASASANAAMAANALTLAGWTTIDPQKAGMWFQVELPQPATLVEVQFDSATTGRGGGAGARGGAGGQGAGGAPAPPAAVPGAAATPPPAPPSPVGFPRQYQVQLSMDGTKWSTPPVATGMGASARTNIAFKATQARFLRITQTGSVDNAPAWSIMNLRLYESGAAPGGK
jgi:mono/diheme cytochrome c family protein